MAVIRGQFNSDDKNMVSMEGIVFGSWRGINYVRRSWKQPYTNSAAQKVNRGQFAEAVRTYQDLNNDDKKKWQDLARVIDYRGSGYNLFISWYLKGADKDNPMY